MIKLPGMERIPDIEIPTPAVGAAAQTAPTLAESTSVAIVAAKGTQEYLGQDFTADMSRMVQEGGKLVLQPISAAFFIALHTQACNARDNAQSALKSEQDNSKELAEKLAAANQKAAVLQERLDAANDNARMRNVFWVMGGSLLGLIPYASEIGGKVGAVTAAVFALACILAALFIRSRPRS
jgi:hypothetical protein